MPIVKLPVADVRKRRMEAVEVSAERLAKLTKLGESLDYRKAQIPAAMKNKNIFLPMSATEPGNFRFFRFHPDLERAIRAEQTEHETVDHNDNEDNEANGLEVEAAKEVVTVEADKELEEEDDDEIEETDVSVEVPATLSSQSITSVKRVGSVQVFNSQDSQPQISISSGSILSQSQQEVHSEEVVPRPESKPESEVEDSDEFFTADEYEEPEPRQSEPRENFTTTQLRAPEVQVEATIDSLSQLSAPLATSTQRVLSQTDTRRTVDTDRELFHRLRKRILRKETPQEPYPMYCFGSVFAVFTTNKLKFTKLCGICGKEACLHVGTTPEHSFQVSILLTYDKQRNIQSVVTQKQLVEAAIPFPEILPHRQRLQRLLDKHPSARRFLANTQYIDWSPLNNLSVDVQGLWTPDGFKIISLKRAAHVQERVTS